MVADFLLMNTLIKTGPSEGETVLKSCDDMFDILGIYFLFKLICISSNEERFKNASSTTGGIILHLQPDGSSNGEKTFHWPFYRWTWPLRRTSRSTPPPPPGPAAPPPPSWSSSSSAGTATGPRSSRTAGSPAPTSRGWRCSARSSPPPALRDGTGQRGYQRSNESKSWKEWTKSKMEERWSSSVWTGAVSRKSFFFLSFFFFLTLAAFFIFSPENLILVKSCCFCAKILKWCDCGRRYRPRLMMSSVPRPAMTESCRAKNDVIVALFIGQDWSIIFVSQGPLVQ